MTDTPHDFEVLMTKRLTAQIIDVNAARFRLHKLWDTPAPDALLAAVGPRLRGLVSGSGHTATAGNAIHAAGLDVYANEPHVPAELTALENVVLLPHVGSGSHKTRAAMGQLVIDNLTSWVEGRGPLTPVTETPWPRTN